MQKSLSFVLFAAPLATLLAATGMNAQTASLSGRIVDARGGEPLASVAVEVSTTHRATSDGAGRFALSGLPPGDYALSAATVGYHAFKLALHLAPDEARTFEIVMSPDSFRRTDAVEVTAGPFEPARQDSPSSLILSGNDVKNLASVLADDPLRAVQSLPGVTSNNDFDARFSLRGADYSRIGLYLDDVLLHQPFHMVAGQNVTASGAAFNGDMVDELELYEGAFPSRFGDRSAGVLEVHTRDGSREATTFRAEASFSNAGVLAEGPLGRRREAGRKPRGAWIVGARKSYLQYLIGRIAPVNDPSLIFGLEDLQGRFSYDLSPASSLTMYLLESYSSLDRSSPKLGINSLARAGYDYTLASLGWKYTPSARFVLATHAAWMREKFENDNPSALRLRDGFYGEWTAGGSGSWTEAAAASLDFGTDLRRVRDQGVSVQYQSATSPAAALPRLLDHFNGAGVLGGAFVQQSWTGLSGRLHLTAGVRGDHASPDRSSSVAPQASASLRLALATRIELGWGQYVQYPEISLLTSPLGGAGLGPAHSIHLLAAVEQRIGERTRIRAEFYNRADRDLPFQPLADPRMVAGKVVVPPVNPPYTTSLRGYSRGAEVFLQRSSANRFTGWISYAFGRTGMREGVTGSRFPSDFDQRHTVNAYVSYRLKPSVNLSLRSGYGSGFPVPGYLAHTSGPFYGGVYNLAGSRNQVRMAPWLRTDLRMNKLWTRDRWKITLYGEVINLTNRTNYLFDSLNGYNTKTGQTSITLDKMLPVLPSLGVVFER